MSAARFVYGLRNVFFSCKTFIPFYSFWLPRFDLTFSLSASRSSSAVNPDLNTLVAAVTFGKGKFESWLLKADFLWWLWYLSNLQDEGKCLWASQSSKQKPTISSQRPNAKSYVTSGLLGPWNLNQFKCLQARRYENDTENVLTNRISRR